MVAAPQHSHQNNNQIWTCLAILAYYCVSSSIVLTYKWLFTNYFSYPLTVTMYLNAIAAFWASLFAYFSGKDFQYPSRQLFWSYVAPIGLCTALEDGCSNVALKILTVSFGTILKGMMPVFTFGWGLVFGLEVFLLQIGGALILIAGGIALALLGVGKDFQLLGFCLIMISRALGGLRWAMTHKLLVGGVSTGNRVDCQSWGCSLNTNDSTSNTTADIDGSLSLLKPAQPIGYPSPVIRCSRHFASSCIPLHGTKQRACNELPTLENARTALPHAPPCPTHRPAPRTALPQDCAPPTARRAYQRQEAHILAR